MKAVVVYESMHAKTHLIAQAIAEGLQRVGEVRVVPVADAAAALPGADLLVVGGPTHAPGGSPSGTGAPAEAAAPGAELELDPDAEGPELRDWFESMGPLGLRAAAFDTRSCGPGQICGRASRGIARRLRQRGCTLVAEPESFLVSADSDPVDEEEAGARRFGERLAGALADRQAAGSHRPVRIAARRLARVLRECIG